MNRNSSSSALHRHALATAVCLALAGGAAQAQLSTSTIKGQIAAAQAGTTVTAVNLANGNSYRTQTLADGSYALTGLAPGAYEIRVGERKSQPVTVQVGETASVDLALPAAGTQTITITGTAQRQGVKDSQVGTNVSRRLIENLPQSTRNFLSSADLAPGVAFNSDDAGNTKIQSGSQNFDHVNVYIDGVGQKNNIIRGGVAGQDSSRGNPFPQSAIAEYKVITQNYKAEFDQVSSAAITAITKSGTNEFHGDAYVDRTGTNWRARSVFEKEREASGVELPASTKYEGGFSLGGPIQQDALHFFVAYDGKKIDDSRQVVLKNTDRFTDLTAGVLPGLIAKQGSTVNPFNEHLFFAKADAQLGDDRHLALSLRVRKETDTLPENRELSLPGNDFDRSNDETRLDLLHQWTIGPWQLDTRAGYEKFQWNPKSASTEPLLKYRNANASPQLLSNSADVIFDGGSPNAQNRQQTGFTLAQEATYNGLAGHVIKSGVRLKDMKYDLSGTSRSVDVIETLIDLDTGLPYFDGTSCTGTAIINNGDTSAQCKIDRALAPASVSLKNKQLGLFIQDDWAVTKQLELNLGLRYDYESNMLNNNYVTPADRVTALFAPDTRTFAGQTADPDQTYAQSIAKGGVDVSQYIADGRSRKPFRKAFAPRLGASFDLFSDKATVLFAGYGRSYDRTMANHALDESQKNAKPGEGEIWLIRNDFKLPFADQFALGVRQAVGEWNTEATLSRIDAKNQFIWFIGNRDLNGGTFLESPLDALSGGPAGYGSLLLGDFVGRTKTNALLLRAEKPFTSASGWSATFAYTYSDARTTHREWNNDIFDFTYGKPGRGGFKPSTLVDKHRLVAAAVADGLLPWGLTLAGKVTLASGFPRRLTVCPGGFPAPNPDPALARAGTCDVVEGYSPSFRQVDVSLSKQLAFGAHKFSLRADVLNLFNVTNYDGFDDFVGAPPAAAGAPTNRLGGDNLNLDKPNSIRGDPRTFRLAVIYRF